LSLPTLLPALLLSTSLPVAAPVDGAQAAVPVSAPMSPVASPVAVSAPAANAPRPRHAKGDPWEKFNRHMFKLYLGLDHAVIRPVAMGYQHVLPRPVRSGLRNFFSNLREPVVFLNYLLQHKVGKAAETFARFAFNSTIGVGGLIDVAKNKNLNLPHRPNGFGDTLGFYGVKPGPYIFLPIGGPTTVRDFLGGQGDALVLPLAVGKPFDQAYYQVPRAIIVGLDTRAEADSDFKALFDSAVDPYATLRSVYLQDRAAEIAALKNRPVVVEGKDLDDPLRDPLAEPDAAPRSTTPELSDPLADPAAPHTTSQ